jgi:hypothetical protein
VPETTDQLKRNTHAGERKLLQLCRQVHHHLELVITGELQDPLFDDLWILDVAPEAGAKVLLVPLVAPDAADCARAPTAPSAYEDIGVVMRAQRELTRVIRRLQPVLSFKG